MSTAAVSTTSLTQAQQYFQTRRADLQQLGKALENGNLAGAQTAYNNIVKLGKSGPFAGGNPFIPQREQEFQAIGTALHAGDLARAQQAFATARAGGTLAQPAPKTASSSGPEIILNLNNSSGTSASPEQITINISPTKGGGEQVAFSIGSQGSTPEQVTLNLAANSNEQIVLNLLGAAPSASGASGSTASGSAASGGLSVTA
jgi:hypothetical protein